MREFGGNVGSLVNVWCRVLEGREREQVDAWKGRDGRNDVGESRVL